MTQRRGTSLGVRAAILLAAVVGVGAVILLLASGSGAGPGRPPASVRARVGDDPLVITVHGNVLALVSSPQVEALAGLEQRLARSRFATAAYGPASWLLAQIAALRGQVRDHTTTRAPRGDQLVRVGADGDLSLHDDSLTSSLVFGAVGTRPRASLAWLFPTGDAARIFVRLAPGVTAAAARRAIGAQPATPGLSGVDLTVSGS